MKRTAMIFLLFIFLTTIFTFPLILQFNTSIPGFHSTDESFGILWNFWWLNYSYLHRLQEYFSPFIASPFGLNLAQSPIYPVGDFINKLLAIGFGDIVAYNLQVLMSFILAAIFIYYLVYSLTTNKLVSIFSAIIYSFCPYHSVRVWQHLSLAQIQWLPLYILALFKLKEKTTLKNIIFVAFSFCLIVFFNYYYAYFALIITFVFAIFILVFDKKERLRIIKSTLISMTVALLILMPVIFPILKTALFTQKIEDLIVSGYLRPFKDLFEQSARPLSYILPVTVHPIFGKFTERFIGSSLYGVSLTEHALYLGWTPLILAFVAFRRWRGRRENLYIGFFVFMAIVAWFFSQSPWWKIGPIKIYMPSFFLYKILPMFRAYCRFGIVVMLAVAVLAGFGLKFILEKFKSQKTKIAITFLFCGLVLFEFWNWPPYKVIGVSIVPTVYSWIKEQPGDFAIAEYPLDVNGPNEMSKFYQTKHEKKIINGTIPGTYANKVAKTITKLSDLHIVRVLKWMGVKYVLVHRQDYLETELIEEIEELNKIPKNLGLKIVKSFPAQQCPQRNIICTQDTGPIDVYEVVAEPIKPGVEQR